MAVTIKGSSGVSLDYSTGGRITGDFSNATIANRVMFQSSTVNGYTAVAVIPNGTSAQSFIAASNNSDPNNAAFMQIDCGPTGAFVRSNTTGTGTYLPMIFQTGGSERMRIDTSGNLLMGATTATDSDSVGIRMRPGATSSTVACTFNSSASGSTYHLYNLNASFSGYRFYVNYNGGIANYSANNTNLSDERVKTNIEVSGGYLDKICAIPVKLFNYKDETSGEQRTLGVIAQDVEAVAPELVNNDGFGETPEDGVPLKTIYQTDLQYALMKCIQELKAELDAARADIAALKATPEK